MQVLQVHPRVCIFCPDECETASSIRGTVSTVMELPSQVPSLAMADDALDDRILKRRKKTTQNEYVDVDREF